MIEVVSGVIVQDGRLLLTQRPSHKDYPYEWETPGGKLERDESCHAALRRELLEELGITVHALPDAPVWAGTIYPAGREAVWIAFMRVPCYQGQLRPLEGQGLGFFTEADLGRISLAPGNRQAYPALRKELGR